MDTNLFRTEEERKVTITPIELEHVLNINPQFESVSEAVYFDNYDLPCPLRVSVQTKNHKVVTIVLRKNRHGDIENEVKIFRALKEFDLPVPEVLVEPFKNEEGEYVAILSFLPGENLQKLGMRSDEVLAQAKELLVQAVITLTNATDFIRKHKVSKIIPSISLTKELEDVNVEENPWFEEEVFQNAVKKLKNIFENITTPLVLSNGDYQPGNFLAQDGKITGFLDFESLSFQDPIMGFVKYPIYDLLPLSRTNIIKIFLDKKGFSEKDFNSRLALGCLKVLKKEIPVSGGDKEIREYKKRILSLLTKSLDSL